MIEHYFYLVCALLSTTFGQLLYRFYHMKRKKIFLVFTLISFVLVPFFSYQSLLGLSIDTVYMATSITIVLVLLGGYLILGEKLSKNQILGSLVIIIGIIIYNVWKEKKYNADIVFILFICNSFVACIFGFISANY